MSARFWRNLAIDSVISVLFGVAAVTVAWSFGLFALWPGFVTGGVVLVLLIWNPGGEK